MSKTALFPQAPRPLVFAHRGASSEAPENTMASFTRAKELGCPGLELDIHRCASGELVVHHDDNLKRTCGLNRPIADCNLSELRELSAGAWFSESFASERIPLLSEVLDAFSPDLYIDIELKSKKAGADPLAPVLAQLLADRNAQNICVSSFNPIVLKDFIRASGGRYPSAIIWSNNDEVPWYLRHGLGRAVSGCSYLKPDFSILNTLSTRILRLDTRREVLPWTIDSIDQAQKALDAGASGIITNKPAILVPFIREYKGN